MLVGVGDHDGDAMEDGDSVHAVGQQPEPLLRHRVLVEEAFHAVLDPPSGDDALLPRTLRWCGTESTRPRLASLPRRLSQSGGRDAPEARHRVRGGQRRGAQQPEGVLQGLA